MLCKNSTGCRLAGRNQFAAPSLAQRLECALVEVGLIERVQDQRIAMTWDTITAEMKLTA
jgi:hypothetical protein